MLNTKRSAFTMLELVFVIVVVGILAAIAIPKFSATRTDAQIAKARADIAAIRSAIVSERQSRLIKGETSWISQLHGKTSGYYFDGNDSTHSLLMYGIKAKSKDGHWKTGASCSGNTCTYTFQIGSDDCAFAYNNTDGTFALKASQPAICDKLVN
ncbi:MAG: type II secretion system protein [Epsilonproteobacteria bacterium]|nr:type II secretion system protein [Campylobacterota bacterium]